MTTTMSKIGRTILAVTLSAFVCLCPPAMAAFAEEDTVTNEEATDTTVVEPDPVEVPEAAEAAGDSEAEEAEPAEEPEADVEGADEAAAIVPMALSADDTAASADEDANPLDVNSDPFDVDNFMELRDAFRYDIKPYSNQSFTINLTNDITLEAPPTKVRDEATHTITFTMDTHGKKYTHDTNAFLASNGNTVTILGHGHTINFTGNTDNNTSFDVYNGTLTLGAADGSDILTLSNGSSSRVTSAMVSAASGTVNIHSGVTLSGNVNGTLYPGGAIDAQNNAVINMDGGTIENSTNSTFPMGGAVALQSGSTFNMSGGTIKGNHVEPADSYEGYGAGVAISPDSAATTFNMSGNASITGNSATNGGGVYVGQNGVFTMSGNASITNNTATNYGGGVYVSQGGTFTMGEGNTIIGNSAQHGGGVINFGTATVTNVYDNDASGSGADIYNDGTITMEPVKAEWSLSKNLATSDPDGDNSNTDVPTDTNPDLGGGIKFQSLAAMPMALSDDAGTVAVGPSNKTIDDWYYDGHRETGETDSNGNAVVDHTRWNANADTADKPQYLMNYVATGTPTTETMGLKAAHAAASTQTPDTPDTINVIWENYDGTVLFTLEKVEVGHVPDGDEYNALSGNENPTEADDGTYEYEFEGWDRSVEPNGDVVYTAEFDAIPENPDTPDGPQTPDEHSTDPTPSGGATPSSDPERNTDVGSLHQTGDKVLALGFGLGAIALLSLGGLGIAKLRASKN